MLVEFGDRASEVFSARHASFCAKRLKRAIPREAPGWAKIPESHPRAQKLAWREMKTSDAKRASGPRIPRAEYGGARSSPGSFPRWPPRAVGGLRGFVPPWPGSLRAHCGTRASDTGHLGVQNTDERTMALEPWGVTWPRRPPRTVAGVCAVGVTWPPKGEKKDFPRKLRRV